MNTIKITSLFVLVLYVFNAKSQDVILSQPLESPITLNPANTGAQYDIRSNLNYRQQWRSVTDPFTTVMASADSKIISSNRSSSLGLGLFIMNDRAGGAHLNTFLGGVNIAAKVPISNSQNISAGIGTAFMQRHIDYSALSWDKQYDGLVYNPGLSSGEQMSNERTNNIDLSTGVQWSYGKGATTLSSNDNFGVQVGVSVFHLNKPNLSFDYNDKSYMRFVLHSTLSYGIKNSNMQISPSFIAAFQGPSKMFYGGALVKYKLQESSKYTDYVLARMLNVGTFYRFGDAIVLMTQLEWGQFAFGISYDINTSSLTRVSSGRGGFEISARYMPMKSGVSSRLL
ncbi:MAG TPA: PorP/SprF family type IX secretion system membrane protein [Bacteroidales bacterium]|jgi:type IX secretion system PorP/SprF family membrane protein|nr:PorP/SprF family type IX secretion system membrane protein [Bacteroidales bacterium]HOU97469.1 PorP/SprF family type IX secretion system membrane protein [Bacteroidales bacterium]